MGTPAPRGEAPEVQNLGRWTGHAWAERFVRALRQGNTRQCAAGLARVRLSWVELDIAADEQFASVVAAAEAEAEQEMLESLAGAARQGDWRAAESWLKRRRRQDYGDHTTVTLLERLAAQVRGMTDEELLRVGGDADPLPAGDAG